MTPRTEAGGPHDERDEIAAIIMKFGYSTIGVTPTAQAAAKLASLIVVRKREAAVLDVERLRQAINLIRDRGLSTSLDAYEIATEYASLATEPSE